MRVRVLRETQAYWNYAIQSFKRDEEYDGDLARHLADNAPKGAVEVLEADPEPGPEPEQPEGVGDSGGGEPGGTPEGGDEPPVDGTIDDLMTWIGGDQERAARALGAEQAKDKPRSTVIKRLSGSAE